MITTQYLKQQEEYSEKYGNNTLVLIQIGSFYEFYMFQPDKCKEILPWPNKKIGHVDEVAKLLNMTATRKDKNKTYSLNNCDMAGFPCVAYEKHRDVLLANNYTIVRIDQKKDSSGNVERFVYEILSPATHLENISSLSLNNNIVSIYIEVLKEDFKKENYIIAVGLSCIDVTTGDNSVLEIYSKDKDAIHAIHEVYRYLNFTNPKQLLLTLNCKDKDYEKFLILSLELDKIDVLISNKYDPEYLKPDYQTQFLSKIFTTETIKNNHNIIEELGLERIFYGRMSYIILINYCYEHNPFLVEKLNNPNTSWLDVDKYLILTHNAANQLDLLPSKNIKKHNRSNKNIDSLFSVVNFTKTSLGKRFLISRLANPMTDEKLLNKCYDMIQDLQANEKLLNELRDLLKNVPDLERYQRKLYLKLIKPNEFNILFQGYIKIAYIYTKIYDSKSKLYNLLFDSNDFNKCLHNVCEKYNLEDFSNCKIDSEKIECEGKFFIKGQDEKFDQYWKDIHLLKNKIETIVDTLNSYLGSTKGKKIFYSTENKKDRNLSLWTTLHKASILQKSNWDKNIVGDLQFVNTNKEVMITSDVIVQTCSDYKNLNEELSKYLYSCYNVTLNEISKYNFFSILNNFIGELDYICSNTKCAIENKYYKPEILDKNCSYLEIQDIRHPIVECLINGEYITNHVTLGLEEKGMLLYGQNSSGKSTLGKAIALNVILAQAGLYTAGKMKYYPYHKIITRLSGNDNLMNGESSFIVETKELRTILRNADEKTLVIADEIARGTESVSAISLSISAICYLIQKKSSFIFSTHLHSLVDMKDIKELGNKLKICHLSLHYDEENKLLIYDRKLKSGSGESIYGLEVAKSLELEPIFMRKAYEIRNSIENKGMKKSKYNSKVYVDSCFICGKEKNLETHHIREQYKSDEKGFIDNMHKNIPGNLRDVCEACHDYLHSKGLSIVSKETNKGISVTLS